MGVITLTFRRHEKKNCSNTKKILFINLQNTETQKGLLYKLNFFSNLIVPINHKR